MGYLSRGMGLPATSDPTQDAYWARADKAMWANANPELAKRAGWDPNRNYQQAVAPGGVDPARSYNVPLAQGAAVAAPGAFAVLDQGAMRPPLDASQSYLQPTAPIDTSVTFREGGAGPVTATAFAPSAATPQEQAGQVLDQYTAQIKATKGINPEVNFNAQGADFDEIDRNAYGLSYNTRQFF
jgi:hypothetical protein